MTLINLFREEQMSSDYEALKNEDHDARLAGVRAKRLAAKMVTAGEHPVPTSTINTAEAVAVGMLAAIKTLSERKL